MRCDLSEDFINRYESSNIIPINSITMVAVRCEIKDSNSETFPAKHGFT